MSALVCVTVCTSDRKIHRFDTLDAAAHFVFGDKATTAAPKTKRKATRRHGENRRLALQLLAGTAEASSVEIAAALGRRVDIVNSLIVALLDCRAITITRRGNRGQRWFALTDIGRAEVARHV